MQNVLRLQKLGQEVVRNGVVTNGCIVKTDADK
jgi:hypothetical protein